MLARERPGGGIDGGQSLESQISALNVALDQALGREAAAIARETRMSQVRARFSPARGFILGWLPLMGRR